MLELPPDAVVQLRKRKFTWRTSVNDLETNIIAVLKEIIEFEDKNNNGFYDADADGDPVQRVEMACLSWTPPQLSTSANKTARR